MLLSWIARHDYINDIELEGPALEIPPSLYCLQIVLEKI